MRTLRFGMLLGLMLAAAAAGAQDKVLLVQSYHTGYPWVDAITAGVEKGLAGSGAQLEIFYMDTKRKTDDAWKAEAGKLAAEKIKELKPKVVITVDDNAQAYLAKDFAGKADAPQFVFCGVNAEAAKYGFPADNVTGILERAHFVQSLEMLLKIKPDIKKIAFISDNSETSDAAIAYAKTLKSPVEIVAWEQPATLAEWQAAVTKCQDSTDALAISNYHTVKKEAGAQSMEPKEVMAWTVANYKKPIVGFFDFGVEDGALCGIVESGEEHGLEAAAIATAILKDNKTARDFPIQTAKKGMILFNVKSAAALGVEIPFDLLRTADKVYEK